MSQALISDYTQYTDTPKSTRVSKTGMYGNSRETKLK